MVFLLLSDSELRVSFFFFPKGIRCLPWGWLTPSHAFPSDPLRSFSNVLPKRSVTASAESGDWFIDIASNNYLADRLGFFGYTTYEQKPSCYLFYFLFLFHIVAGTLLGLPAPASQGQAWMDLNLHRL